MYRRENFRDDRENLDHSAGVEDLCDDSVEIGVVSVIVELILITEVT